MRVRSGSVGASYYDEAREPGGEPRPVLEALRQHDLAALGEQSARPQDFIAQELVERSRHPTGGGVKATWVVVA